MLGHVQIYDNSDKFQFGFKQADSTTLCTGIVIDYEP